MDELSEERLRSLIDDALRNGYVVPSKHAREQMPLRNYSMADIIYIIRNGSYVGADLREGRYGYTFEGDDIEGHPGCVVVGFNETLDKMIIVTVKGGVK